MKTENEALEAVIMTSSTNLIVRLALSVIYMRLRLRTALKCLLLVYPGYT